MATRCAVEPPGGVVVTTGRARPTAVVGPTQVVILHRNRGGGISNGMDNPWGAHALALPVGSARAETLIGPTSNSTYLNWANVERLGDAVLIEECGFESNLANVSCSIRFFDAATPRTTVTLPTPRVEMDGAARFVVARRVDTYFALLAYRGAERNGVAAYRFGASGRAIGGRIGPGSGQIDPREAEQLDLRIDPRDDGAAAFDVGFVRSGSYTRYAMAADGAVGDGAEVAEPAATVAAIAGIRAAEGEPQHLRVVGASALPIAGIDETAVTFAPSFVEQMGATTLVWSEGTGDTTRIRLARVDGPAARLLGPIAEVSAAGLEAGFATLDTYGSHTVVTWDEKHGRVWEVRAAEVRCAL
jgi:hypothetical protein